MSQLLQEQPHEIRLLVRSIPAVGTPEYNGDSRIRYVKGALLDAKILYDVRCCIDCDMIGGTRNQSIDQSIGRPVSVSMESFTWLV